MTLHLKGLFSSPQRYCMFPVVCRLLFSGQSVAGDLSGRAAVGAGLRRSQSHHRVLLLFHPLLGVYAYTCRFPLPSLSFARLWACGYHHHLIFDHLHARVCVFRVISVCWPWTHLRAFPSRRSSSCCPRPPRPSLKSNTAAHTWLTWAASRRRCLFDRVCVCVVLLTKHLTAENCIARIYFNWDS